jgi:hypothetical protein
MLKQLYIKTPYQFLVKELIFPSRQIKESCYNLLTIFNLGDQHETLK